MAVYQITYQLSESKEQYEPLYAAIETLGDSVREKNLCWFVETPRDPTQIRDELKKHMLKTDRLLITKKSTDEPTWAASFTDPTTAWLKEH